MLSTQKPSSLTLTTNFRVELLAAVHPAAFSRVGASASERFVFDCEAGERRTKLEPFVRSNLIVTCSKNIIENLPKRMQQDSSRRYPAPEKSRRLQNQTNTYATNKYDQANAKLNL